MRRLGLIALVLLASSLARAETAADDSDPSSAAVPTSADVISQLFQFDLFQQNAIDSAEHRATQDIANTAAVRADAAIKRDKGLAELQRKTGAVLTSRKTTAAMRAHALSGVDSSDGADYVREFYAAQLAEYESTVSLLERYLQSPDNEDVRDFATAQLTTLRSELADTRSALADK
jgi:Domain of unknown function (DUF4142)